MQKEQDGTVKKYIYSLFLPYKKELAWIFVCLMSMSVLTFFQPLIIQKITDCGMVEKDLRLIIYYSSWLLVSSVFYQFIDIIQTYLFSNIHNKTKFVLYEQVYWKMNKLQISYYRENGSTEFFHTISNDIGSITSIIKQISEFSITAILQVLGGIIGLSILNWKLAFLIMLFIPLKFLAIRCFSKLKKKRIEQMINNNRAFSEWIGECIDGIFEMKLWNLFQKKHIQFKKLQKEMMSSYRKNCMLDKYKQTCISFLDVSLNALIYVFSGMLIIKGDFTIGSAFAFITYCSYVVAPISFLVEVKYYFAEIVPSAKRYIEYINLPEEKMLVDKSNEKKNSVSQIEKKVPILELCGVKFGYAHKEEILKNINLSVKQGDKIAIIGENGSGKSTLIDLILGFYQPDKGSIRIRGIDSSELRVEEIREIISVVYQKIHFFKGTLEQNVNIDGKGTFDTVISNCTKSGAIKFIDNLQDGFAYDIGKNGEKLSKGERQKLAIARALTKKSEILILDEATSSIDKESNVKLIGEICNELEEKTIILITHRYEELKGIKKYIDCKMEN